jgi:hypothetical protein
LLAYHIYGSACIKRNLYSSTKALIVKAVEHMAIEAGYRDTATRSQSAALGSAMVPDRRYTSVCIPLTFEFTEKPPHPVLSETVSTYLSDSGQQEAAIRLCIADAFVDVAPLFTLYVI